MTGIKFLSPTERQREKQNLLKLTLIFLFYPRLIKQSLKKRKMAMTITIDNRNIEDMNDILFFILNGRKKQIDKLTDLQSAIAILQATILEKGLQNSQELTSLVASLESAVKAHSLSWMGTTPLFKPGYYDELPLLSELAYRTALKIKNPKHPGNNEHYCTLLTKIQTRADKSHDTGLWFQEVAAVLEAATGLFVMLKALFIALTPVPGMFFAGCAVMGAGATLCADAYKRHMQCMRKIQVGEKYEQVNTVALNVNSFLQSRKPDKDESDTDTEELSSDMTKESLSTDDTDYSAQIEGTPILIINRKMQDIDDVLFCILNGREYNDKLIDFNTAIDVLERVMQENNLADDPALQAFVKSLKEVKSSNLSFNEFPLLSELAYRTAFAIQNPNHVNNNKRYSEILEEVENRANKLDNQHHSPSSAQYKKVFLTAEKVFGILLFLGGLALTCTGFLPGIALMAAGVLIYKEGDKLSKQLSAQCDAKEKFQNINASIPRCVSTLFSNKGNQARAVVATVAHQKPVHTSAM